MGGYRHFGKTARCHKAENLHPNTHRWENLKTCKWKCLFTWKAMLEILKKLSDMNNMAAFHLHSDNTASSNSILLFIDVPKTNNDCYPIFVVRECGIYKWLFSMEITGWDSEKFTKELKYWNESEECCNECSGRPSVVALVRVNEQTDQLIQQIRWMSVNENASEISIGHGKKRGVRKF